MHCSTHRAITRVGAALLAVTVTLASVGGQLAAPDHTPLDADGAPRICTGAPTQPSHRAKDNESSASAFEYAAPVAPGISGPAGDPPAHPLCIAFLDRCRAGYPEPLDRPPDPR